MTDETDTRSAVARVLTEHFDPTGSERHDPYAQATYQEAAQALAEAGLLREEPFSVEGMEIMSGWLVEPAGEHTCGAGGSESGYAHEPGCGYVPVQRLDDLPGWPGAQHQADVEQLGQSIIALLDQVGQLQARLARLTEERAAECIGNAFERWASDPTVRDAARRVVAMVQAEPPEAQDEHDHRWIEQTTYADSARGVTVSACTVPGCRAELEERA